MSQDKAMDPRLLDRIAAGRAQNIVSTAMGEIEGPGKDRATAVDNLATKALGVLQENGVYACFLFLLSRTQEKEKAIASAVRVELVELAAADLGFGWGRLDKSAAKQWQAAEVLDYASGELCAELDPLLLVKQVFEQALIYVRYGAKARKNNGQEGEKQAKGEEKQ